MKVELLNECADVYWLYDIAIAELLNETLIVACERVASNQ